MAGAFKGMATQDLMEVLMVSRSALECSTPDELVPELLRLLEGIFKARGSTFFFTRHLAHTPNLNRVISRGIEERFLTLFREYYHRLDPFLRHYRDPGSYVHTTQQIISFRDLIRCEYYNDFLKPQSIHHQMSIYLRRDRYLLGVLSLFRPKSASPFSSLDVAKADLMIPHLSGALEKSLISQKMLRRSSFIDSIVSGLPYKGIMVVDPSLEPIYQDDNAAGILSDLTAAEGGEDAPVEPLPGDIRRRCEDLIGSIKGGRDFKPRRIQFDSALAGNRSKVPIEIQLIRDRDGNPLLLICFDPEKPLSRLLKRSREHGLTRREAEVASLLSEGAANREIAGRLFISEYTVENHLRSIYRKLNVRNRTALAHRLMGMRSRAFEFRPG